MVEERQVVLSERDELNLRDEEDLRQWRKEKERFEVIPKTLGDYRMQWRRAARRYLHQKRCMAYWAQSDYGGMDRFAEARKLDFLRMCLDKVRGELRWAIEQVNKAKGI